MRLMAFMSKMVDWTLKSTGAASGSSMVGPVGPSVPAACLFFELGTMRNTKSQSPIKTAKITIKG